MTVKRTAGLTPAAARPGRLATAVAVSATGLLLSLPGRVQPAPHTMLPAAAEEAVSSIVASDLETHVRHLASSDLEGRGAGQPGNDAAALYIAGALERHSIPPADGTSYYQPFDLQTVAIGGTNRLEFIEFDDAAPVRYGVGDDFHPYPSSASAAVSGELVFAGYGLSAPELRYDDYTGLDVVGRIVVVLDREPQEGDETGRFAGRRRSAHASLVGKVATAAGRGAAALIVIPNVARSSGGAAHTWNARDTARRNRFVQTADIITDELPIALVSAALGERLLQTPEEPHVRIAALQDSIDQAIRRTPTDRSVQAPASFAVPSRQVALEVSVERRVVQPRNVLGLIEGRDAGRRNDLVIVGAHLDHEGVDDDDRIFHGADDNASGVAGVLEIAEALRRAASRGDHPRRSVLFAFWNAEEKGLVGSRHYLDHQVPAGATIVAKLNLDMIGRSEDVPGSSDPRLASFRRTTAAENVNMLHLIGTTYSRDLGRTLRDANAAVGLTLRTEYDSHPSNLLRRSDHWPFLERGIPALFITTGLHPDYHTPEDTADRIDYRKLERVTRLVYRSVWQLANQDSAPMYVTP